MGEAISSVSTSSRLTWASPNDASRHELEAAIYTGFAHAFGADLHEFYPLLSQLSYRRSRCFLGVRLAANAPLFVEQYLQQPLELHLGKQVKRSEIAELGNLYSTGRMATLGHFIILTEALLQHSIHHLVFTATQQVRSLLSLCQVEAQIISNANGNIASAKDYGSYYQCVPKVCVVNLRHAQQVIQSTALYKHALHELSPEAVNLKEALNYA